MTREEATAIQAQAQAAGQIAGLVNYPDDTFGVRLWPADGDPTGPPAQEIRAVDEYTPPKGGRKQKDEDK